MVKIEKIQKILIDEDKIPKLIRDFGCSRATVYNAITFKTNSKKAQGIRTQACNRYGGEVVKVPVKRR